MNVLDKNWLRSLVTLVAVASSTSVALGQLAIVTNAEPQRVFFGRAKDIAVRVHNDGSSGFKGEITARMLQTSSATAVMIGETSWKNLQMLPGQTIVASAQLDFPAVKAETKFLVQWLAGTNRVIGTTEVWVYPTNLLAELKSLMSGETLGVLDPNSELKPLLRQNDVSFVDLSQASLEGFSGRLMILGPFRARAQMPEDAARRCKLVAKNGASVVWLQPPPGPREPLQPSFYSVPAGTNAIVVVQSGVVAGLAENPQAQQRLVQLCRLALHPEPITLPETNRQP